MRKRFLIQTKMQELWNKKINGKWMKKNKNLTSISS